MAPGRLVAITAANVMQRVQIIGRLSRHSVTLASVSKKGGAVNALNVACCHHGR